MSTTTSIPTSAPLPRSSSLSAGGHLHGDASAVNGHHSHVHDHSTAPNPGLSNASKKGKMKKTTDPNEASKLIAAKISQLELDAAGEKDQEAEIGASKLSTPLCCCKAHNERFASCASPAPTLSGCLGTQSHNMRQTTLSYTSRAPLVEIFLYFALPS